MAAKGKAKTAPKEAAPKGKRKSVEKAKEDGAELDDIFTKRPTRAAAKPSGEAAPAAKKQAKGKGPDMEEVKREEDKYKGKKKAGGRDVVDGVPVYSLAELEDEMGDKAWEAFMDAAEPGLK